MLYNYARGRFLENRRESDKVRKKLIEEKVPFSEDDFDALVPLAKKIRKRYTILNKI